VFREEGVEVWGAYLFFSFEQEFDVYRQQRRRSVFSVFASSFQEGLDSLDRAQEAALVVLLLLA
jgi:hypothetical protein